MDPDPEPDPESSPAATGVAAAMPSEARLCRIKGLGRAKWKVSDYITYCHDSWVRETPTYGRPELGECDISTLESTPP